jgi:membrane fusion protein (multidrug efflux system)
MSFSRRTLSLVTVLLVLAALIVGVGWRLELFSPGSEDDATDVAAGTEVDLPEMSGGSQFSADMPQPVGGAEVLLDTLWIRVRAAGQAEAIRRTALTSQVAGVVQGLPIQENQSVGTGAPLVRLDSTEYALGVDQAQANLLSAETDYRQLILFDDEIEDPAIRAERDRIARTRSSLDQRNVDLRQAELQLERSRITAPFGGRIADIRVVEGQYVSVGTELLTLVDLDPIKVEVQVLEAELGSLAEGRRAEVSFAAFPGETFVGSVETINPLVDPDSRTGRVTVLLANPEHRIKPGMYAEVLLDAEALPDRILVPRAAILERGEGTRRTMLFVYGPNGNAGVAEWRYVNPGRENDTYVEILSEGLEQGMVAPGEIVLVDGHHYLAHDTAVRLVENVEAEGGRPSR